MTVTRRRSSSPGRTGGSQRNSSIPGEARLDAGDRKCVAKSRIITAAVCQPLAISPPKWPRAAAAGSVCIACGSYCRANSRISAPLTMTGPPSNTAPGG